MTKSTTAFNDPMFVDSYVDRVARVLPVRDIHRMTAILIDEHAPPQATILVLGAGGGLETKALADTHPGWSFDAVDPSLAMLDLAAATLGPLAERVRFHTGYVDVAPPGPFDAAVGLLTMHFLDAAERVRTAGEVRRRLAPGAPFVVVHLSFPQGDDVERQLWMRRYVANLIAGGIDAADARAASETLTESVPALTPEHDIAILREAGFTNITEFFSAFTFRGWVAYA